MSYHVLIEDPTEENARTYVAEMVEQNLRFVKAQELVRGVVDDLKEGEDDGVLAEILRQREQIDATRIKARDPVRAAKEFKLERMRKSLKKAVEEGRTQHEARAPVGGIGTIQLLYFFSPSCPHCTRMTPEVQRFQGRWGSSVEVIGVPVELAGETITVSDLERYRRSHHLSFDLVGRKKNVGKLVFAHGIGSTGEDGRPIGVPYAVFSFPEVPEGPVHVPLPTNVQTAEGLETWLHGFLEQLYMPEDEA